jgi:hypothetical protein
MKELVTWDIALAMGFVLLGIIFLPDEELERMLKRVSWFMFGRFFKRFWPLIRLWTLFRPER